MIVLHGISPLRGREGLESPDGLCGGYPLLWPGTHDQDGGNSAGYRRWYETGI